MAHDVPYISRSSSLVGFEVSFLESTTAVWNAALWATILI